MGSSKSLLFVATVCLLGCTDERASTMGFSARSDAGLQSGLTLLLNVAGRDDVFACGAGFTTAQVQDDQVRAIKEAPSHCLGSEGGFLCECDGVAKDNYAFGCVAALYEACDVEAEPVDGSDEPVEFPSDCESAGDSVSGRCEREGSGYACACDDGDELAPSANAADESPLACEQALFAACAQACEGDFGACEPSDDGAIGEYACTCSTNQFGHRARAASCEEALLAACSPLNESEESCTGYGGACVATDRQTQTELDCTCVDRSTQVVDHVPALTEPRWRACRETLEATCGLGSPPEGAQCLAEGNGYKARCTRGPSTDATLTCECYADDATEARVDEVASHSCDMATLLDFCPELAE